MTDYDEKIKMLIMFGTGNFEYGEGSVVELCAQMAREIKNAYELRSDIFFFQKRNNSRDIFATFKAIIEESTVELPNVKFINGKPEANCFFSINALNHLIKGEIGELDHSHQINGKAHQNKLIMLKKSKEIEGRKVLSETQIDRVGRCIVEKEGLSVKLYPSFLAHQTNDEEIVND